MREIFLWLAEGLPTHLVNGDLIFMLLLCLGAGWFFGWMQGYGKP